jgi:hypothetical protein
MRHGLMRKQKAVRTNGKTIMRTYWVKASNTGHKAGRGALNLIADIGATGRAGITSAVHHEVGAHIGGAIGRNMGRLTMLPGAGWVGEHTGSFIGSFAASMIGRRRVGRVYRSTYTALGGKNTPPTRKRR